MSPCVGARRCAPGLLVPPLEVVQAHGAQTAEQHLVFFDGHVLEHWDLELRKGSEVGPVVFQDDGELGHQILPRGPDQQPSAQATAEATLYKELTASAPVTEEGTYYWRLKWRKDPSNAAAGHYERERDLPIHHWQWGWRDHATHQPGTDGQLRGTVRPVGHSRRSRPLVSWS